MKLSGPAKKMTWILLAALPLLAGGAAAYYRSWAFLPFAGGALLGTALGIAKVLLLDHAVKKLAGMEAARAGNYARAQSMLRFLLTALVLALPAFSAKWGVPLGVFWGAAACVLVYQLAIYAMKLLTKRGEAP